MPVIDSDDPDPRREPAAAALNALAHNFNHDCTRLKSSVP